MHILCPHCKNPIEVLKLTPREEIACPSCGSSFRLDTESTTGGACRPGQRLGKFEVIDVVGQGAFGTVYKARDAELDRVVAVKAPRAGNVAGPQELDRFLREARSAAQLRHPSIVSVHEVGQADGVPFIVSDFVQGATLADLLSARRPTFRESAELIAAVADALQYAHDRGVIHRDVKPSNIMIEEDGRPLLTDFGLAKRDAGEITMTVEGQVLGTPAYMAPEQARGDGHTVDGRADIYSLGVVLYELLTGELPFRGTQRMLLLQVLQDEPRPPRRLNDKIPRDLETICLKAMAKEPGRRYQTARELADDLRRWLKGEPIQARPVGRAARAARWARRNPRVAALLALFVLTLVSGTAVSVYFALDARRGEQDARDALGKVTERERQLREANVNLDAANTHLNEKDTELEETLAVSLLRPLGHDPGDTPTTTPGPILDAVWDLARSNERVHRLFIDRALQGPATTQWVRFHADLAVHAAVGLDPARRRRVEDALLSRLRETDDDLSAQADCVVIGLALGRPDPDYASASTRQALELIGQVKAPRFDLEPFADVVKAGAPRLRPAEASAATRLALDGLRQAPSARARGVLAKAAAALAARRDPAAADADVREAARLLLEMMGKPNDRPSMSDLIEAWATLAPRLGPDEAAAAQGAARQALSAMGTTDDLAALEAFGRVLELAPQPEFDEAATAAARRAVANLLRLAPGSAKSGLPFPSDALDAVSAWMPPADAAASVREALEVAGRTTDRNAMFLQSEVVRGLAAALTSADAADAAGRLLDLIGKPSGQPAPQPLSPQSFLANALPALTRRVGGAEAPGVARQIVRAVVQTKDAGCQNALARALIVLAPRLGPADAAADARLILEAMQQTNDENLLSAGAASVRWLRPRKGSAEAEAARRVVRRALEEMREPDSFNRYPVLAVVLSGLAPSLEPGEASAAARQAQARIDEAMGKQTDELTAQGLAFATAALLPWLDSDEASAAAGRAARKALATLRSRQALNSALAPDTRVSYMLGPLGTSAPWLDPEEASDAYRELLADMARQRNPWNLVSCEPTLTALAPRLSPCEASAVAGLAVGVVGRAEDPQYTTRLGYKSMAALLAAPDFGDGTPSRRIGAAAAGVGMSCLAPAAWAGLPPLADASRPLPGRVTEQQLVNLLKMPTCLQPAREVIVRQLGWQCGQTFADEWDFVDWAKEHRPDLDLTSPPVRPTYP